MTDSFWVDSLFTLIQTLTFLTYKSNRNSQTQLLLLKQGTLLKRLSSLFSLLHQLFLVLMILQSFLNFKKVFKYHTLPKI